MTKEWVNKKNKEYQEKTSLIKFELADKIRKLDCVPEKHIQDFLNKLIEIETTVQNPKLEEDEMYEKVYSIDPMGSVRNYICGIDDDGKLEIRSFRCKLNLYEDVARFRDRLFYNTPFSQYEDSEIVQFEGDIIITDPCYIKLKNSSNEDEIFSKYIDRYTIYGDWSCGTFNSDTRELIGKFCADGARVGVFLLDEVLDYNPNFDYHLNREWTTTWIKNFSGTVQAIISDHPYEYKGKERVEYELNLVGKGIDTETQKPLNFVTKQTGL